MATERNISFAVTAKELNILDKMVSIKGFCSRSEAIRHCIRAYSERSLR